LAQDALGVNKVLRDLHVLLVDLNSVGVEAELLRDPNFVSQATADIQETRTVSAQPLHSPQRRDESQNRETGIGVISCVVVRKYLPDCEFERVIEATESCQITNVRRFQVRQVAGDVL
jgi:hypothetical protein